MASLPKINEEKYKNKCTRIEVSTLPHLLAISRF